MLAFLCTVFPPRRGSSSLLNGYMLKVASRSHRLAPCTWAIIQSLLWTRSPILLIEEAQCIFPPGSFISASSRDRVVRRQQGEVRSIHPVESSLTLGTCSVSDTARPQKNLLSVSEGGFVSPWEGPAVTATPGGSLDGAPRHSGFFPAGSCSSLTTWMWAVI